MSLVDIFQPFAKALGPENCSFAGPDKIDDTSRPPRITWRPVGARHQPARRIDGGAGDRGPILTRHWAVQIDVWGKDLANAEELADLFLANAHRLLSKHSYKPGEETWNAGGVTGIGAVCSMVVYIERPILRTPDVTAQATTIVVKTDVGGDAVTETITET